MQDHKKVIIKKRFLIAAGVFAAIFCVLACFVLLYQKGFFLPGWITWNEKEEVFSDGFEFVLSDSKLSFIGSENGKKIPVYEFDDKLKFSDFLIYDVDGDGDRELVTLLWKQGIYGNAKPFWQKDNRIKWSQHIFIYDVVPDDKGNPIAQKWCTSQLGRLVKRWRVLDESENIKLSKNPNIVTLLLEDANDKITLWAWKSWGLKNYDSSVRFVSVGDNIIHKDILEYGLYQKGGNFDFLYKKYKEEIQNADISTVNLESILVDDPEFYSAYPYFGSPLGVGDALVKN